MLTYIQVVVVRVTIMTENIVKDWHYLHYIRMLCFGFV